MKWHVAVTVHGR